MKKQKTRFVLAEATLAEVNKQLKLNMLVTVIVVFVLFMNIIKFMAEKIVFLRRTRSNNDLIIILSSKRLAVFLR